MTKKNTKPTVGAKLAGEIGSTNTHALESIAIAYRASLSLISMGCSVVGVMTGWRNPVVQLSSPPDGVLEGGLHTSRITRNGVIRIYATSYMGAQIEWRKHTCQH